MFTSNQATTTRGNAFEQAVRKRGRECTRCGGRHRDTVYRTCQPCRELTALMHQNYRLDHKARKLCTECVQKKGKETILCEVHRKYRKDWFQAFYQARRAAGRCVYGACEELCETALCETHAAAQRIRQHNYWRRSRQPYAFRRRAA